MSAIIEQQKISFQHSLNKGRSALNKDQALSEKRQISFNTSNKALSA